MSNFVVGVTLQANGKGLVGEMNAVAGSVDKLSNAERTNANASKVMAAAAERNAVASQKVGLSAKDAANRMRGLGQQFGDFSLQVSTGTNVAVAFAQQAGQIAFALEGAGGKLGTFARFLGGPYGAAVLAATTVAGLFAAKLFETSKASEKAKEEAEKHKQAIETLRQAQEDATTTARRALALSAAKLELDRKERIEIIQKALAELEYAKALQESNRMRATRGGPQGEALALGLAGGDARVAALTKNIAKLTDDLGKATTAANTAIGRVVADSVESRRDPRKAAEARYERDSKAALANFAAGSERQVKALNAAAAARDAEIKRLDATDKALKRTTATRDTADAVTASQVGNILKAAFGGSVTSTARSPAQNAAAGGAKGSYHLSGRAVDFVPRGGVGATSKSQIRAALEAAGVNIKELLGPGDKGHADHFHIAFTKGKLAAQQFIDTQKEANRQAEELDRLLELVERAYDPIGAAARDYREELEKIAALVAAGKLDPSKAIGFEIQAAQRASTRANDDLRKRSEDFYRDQGIDPAEDMRKIGEAIEREAGEAIEAKARQFEERFGAGIDGIARLFSDRLAYVLDTLTRQQGKGGSLAKIIGSIGAGRDAFRDGKRIGDQIEGVTSKLGKLTAKLGYLAESAAFGSTVSGLVGSLGIKQSKIGGAIGGALGGAIAGPIGSAIGGALGGTIGGLFKKTPKGSVQINQSGATYSGSGKFRDSLSSAGGAVNDSLSAIADQLGGTVGSYSAVIKQKGKKIYANGAKVSDIEAATSKILQDALASGAVEGLSAAVSRALASSTNVDKALREALKVQDVEDLLGDLGATVGGALRTFERQAKDRLRIATQYGFDVVKLEAKNAEDRKKLIDDAISERVGSLQSLLKDISFGDLFEGTLTDKRNKLLAEIDTAEADARAGKEGAANIVADLRRSLVELSRDAFGTAGSEFAADLSSTQAAANAIIKLETDRVNAAAAAAREGNALLSESNDLAAMANAKLDAIITSLGVLGLSGGGGGVNLSATARSTAFL